MDETPDTRRSLLVRLGNPNDAQAWAEFVEIYEPLIYRLARRKGFQDADAEELTQEALIAVASAIGRWNDNPNRGPFRRWLFCIARNMMINFLTRLRPEERGVGGSGLRELLEQRPAPAADEEAVFGWEYRREIFRWAARHVRAEFHDSTWQAFWRTCVEGEEIQEVARAIGISVGAVYTARSRAMARIRSVIQEFGER